MNPVSIDDVLTCPTLPTLPAVAIQVLELTGDEDVEITEIARVVHNDPALSAKVLRTVNSSYYGLSSPCPTIARALAYLGLSTVKSLVLGFGLVRMAGEGEEGWDLSAFWQRCLLAAAAARRLASIGSAMDPEIAFTAALVQDLGMLALRAAARETYAGVVRETHGDHRRLPEAEARSLGFDHAEVGARLAERWHFPLELVEAIRRHHHPPPDGGVDLVTVVALAAEIAMGMSLPNPGAALARAGACVVERFGIDAAAVNELILAVSEEASALGALLELDTGTPLDTNMILAAAEDASVRNQLAMQREAETLRRQNDELMSLANTDGLTNVGNRTRFDEELAGRFEQAAAFRGSLGLIILDLDRFKSVNDTYGHPAGDAVLIELARRLQGAVRGMDLVCRYGGEEFGVILPGATLADVAAIAERVRAAVAGTPFDLGRMPGGGEPLPVTASLGAAVFDPTTAGVLRSPSLLVQAADRALYAAKAGGRNCVRVFRPDPKAADAA